MSHRGAEILKLTALHIVTSALVFISIRFISEKFGIPISAIAPLLLFFIIGYLLYSGCTNFPLRNCVILIWLTAGFLILGITQLIGHYVLEEPISFKMLHIMFVLVPLFFTDRKQFENKEKSKDYMAKH